MAAQVRVLRQRIRSAKGMKKITKAMELVATSRIAKAQARVEASLPYARAITGVLTALASNARIDHPLLTPRERVRRAGVLLVTADRGLAGGYSSNAIKTAESLLARLREDGKEPVLYVIGRKGVSFYRFRNRPIERTGPGSRSSRRSPTRAPWVRRSSRRSRRVRTTSTAAPGRTVCSASTNCTSSTPSSTR